MAPTPQRALRDGMGTAKVEDSETLLIWGWGAFTAECFSGLGDYAV